MRSYEADELETSACVWIVYVVGWGGESVRKYKHERKLPVASYLECIRSFGRQEKTSW